MHDLYLFMQSEFHVMGNIRAYNTKISVLHAVYTG